MLHTCAPDSPRGGEHLDARVVLLSSAPKSVAEEIAVARAQLCEAALSNCIQRRPSERPRRPLKLVPCIRRSADVFATDRPLELVARREPSADTLATATYRPMKPVVWALVEQSIFTMNRGLALAAGAVRATSWLRRSSALVAVQQIVCTQSAGWGCCNNNVRTAERKMSIKA